MSIKLPYEVTQHKTAEGLLHTAKTGEPSLITVDGVELVVLRKRALTVLLDHITEDELYDCEFLGASEEHAKPKQMNPKLTEQLRKAKEIRENSLASQNTNTPST